jgi:hypothetical protein
MPPVAAALLPHPPLLVRELAGGAVNELDPLRAACRQALDAVGAASTITILIGDGPVWGVPAPTAPGSFAPYGADLQVALPSLVDIPAPSGLPAPVWLDELPLSLAVAAYLMADLDPAPARLVAATVPASLGPGAAAAVGRTLAAAAAAASAAGARPGPDGSVGLVVMGDLSACRNERAPGGFRPQAARFDASVAEAFRAGEPGRLLDLDPSEAIELQVAGRAPLQVLAGALEDAPAMRGRVLHQEAPYGVGYLVALLTAP